jgi:hypothetical protein
LNCKGKPYLGDPFNQSFVFYFFGAPEIRGLQSPQEVIDWRIVVVLLQNAPRAASSGGPTPLG